MDLDAVLAATAQGRPRRRARPHQRAGLGAEREALAGCHRDPRRGDRCHHDGQHPAPREHRRRGRAHDGAQVRERVPDWVVRKADQIELVDSSPEQLRRRMLHGNIYPKEKVPQALDQLLPHRQPDRAARAGAAIPGRRDRRGAAGAPAAARVRGLWETCERIMVAVTGAPGTDALLRRAARMAARLKGELDVVHVAGSDATRPAIAGRIEKLRRTGGRRRRALARGAGRRPRPGYRRIRQRAPDHPDRDRVQPAQPLAAAAGGGSNVTRVIERRVRLASTSTSSPCARRLPPRHPKRMPPSVLAHPR